MESELLVGLWGAKRMFRGRSFSTDRSVDAKRETIREPFLTLGKPFDPLDEKNPVSDSDAVEAVLTKRSDWEKLQQLKEGRMLISVSKVMGESKKKQ